MTTILLVATKLLLWWWWPCVPPHPLHVWCHVPHHPLVMMARQHRCRVQHVRRLLGPQGTEGVTMQRRCTPGRGTLPTHVPILLLRMRILMLLPQWMRHVGRWPLRRLWDIVHHAMLLPLATMWPATVQRRGWGWAIVRTMGAIDPLHRRRCLRIRLRMGVHMPPVIVHPWECHHATLGCCGAIGLQCCHQWRGCGIVKFLILQHGRRSALC